jgi:hypothetical protein
LNLSEFAAVSVEIYFGSSARLTIARRFFGKRSTIKTILVATASVRLKLFLAKLNGILQNKIDFMFEREENNFIPGIFNYCDRWCERCPLTARCSVYAMVEDEQQAEEYAGGARAATQEAFWRNLQNIFTETKEMLREAAAERGIDIDQLDLKEAGEIIERQRCSVEQQNLMKLAEKYTKQAGVFLKTQNLSDETLDYMQLEMLQIIGWYHYFIAAKINRALYAEADYEKYADSDAFRNDGDGSIKIALIAIDRSIIAWKVLLNDETNREIKPLIQLLDTLRRLCEVRFPNARDFLRPGFDEIIEMVM